MGAGGLRKPRIEKGPAGAFLPPGRKAPGRNCSHPPAYVSLTFAQKKTASVSLHQRFFYGRGWITQAAHLKRPRRGLFAAGTYSGGRCCSNPPLRRFTNFQIKQKLQCHYNTGVLGGRGWIRTTEAESSRFTVCPHWPLGNTPIYSFSQSRTACIYYHLGAYLSTAFYSFFRKEADRTAQSRGRP